VKTATAHQTQEAEILDAIKATMATVATSTAKVRAIRKARAKVEGSRHV